MTLAVAAAVNRSVAERERVLPKHRRSLLMARISIVALVSYPITFQRRTCHCLSRRMANTKDAAAVPSTAHHSTAVRNKA